jgi:hypothetical protein
MMDKIRTARTGKKKQAPAVKGDKYLPKFADGGDVSSTAEASAPAFSYPGSGMSLADISALGNLISRSGNVPAQEPTYAVNPLSNDALNARLAAAKANRPTVKPVMLPVQPKTDTQASGLSRFFRGLYYDAAAYDPLNNSGGS